MLKYCVSISADGNHESEWEEIARFKHKGSAWMHAVTTRDSLAPLGRFSRVTDTRGKQIAIFHPVETPDTEPASA